MSFDLVDLTPLVQQLLYGRTDPADEAVGGIMTACSLTEAQVVAEDDEGDRPTGLFLTFAVPDAGGTPLRDHPHNPYKRVDPDPDDENGCLLVREKVSRHTLRISVHAPARTYTSEEVFAVAKRAQRYLEAQAQGELNLLGMDALIVDPGTVRDATTRLNRSIERVARFEVRLHVGETTTTAVGTFDTMTFTLQEGDDDGTQESKEIP